MVIDIDMIEEWVKMGCDSDGISYSNHPEIRDRFIRLYPKIGFGVAHEWVKCAHTWHFGGSGMNAGTSFRANKDESKRM
jgi:hypothetical protein